MSLVETAALQLVFLDSLYTRSISHNSTEAATTTLIEGIDGFFVTSVVKLEGGDEVNNW